MKHSTGLPVVEPSIGFETFANNFQAYAVDDGYGM